MTEAQASAGTQASFGKVLARIVGWLIVAVFVSVLSAWSFFAISYSNLPSQGLRTTVAVLFLMGTLAAFVVRKNRKKTTLQFLVVFAIVLTWWLFIPASHDRNWLPIYERIPYGEFDGDLVTIHDIRNFEFRSLEDFTPAYYDRTYNTQELTSVDLILSYWDGNTDIAHFIMSFGFRDEEYLAVSIETRREVGEVWSTHGGFFKQYELMIILGDERDLLGQRTGFRNEEVYVYPTNLDLEEGRQVFRNVIDRVNRLKAKPSWYNTITTNCLTSFEPMVHKYRRSKGFDIRRYLNGRSDEMAYENGVFATDLSFAEFKARHHINQYLDGPATPEDYSRRIRPHLRGL